MKIGITHKLFLVVLAIAIFAVVVVSTATHWSFTRGFLDYLNELAIERMTFVAARTEQAYARHGNWDFLRDNDNPAAWFRLARPALGQELPDNPEPGRWVPVSDLTGAMMRMGLVDAQQQWVAGYRDLTAAMLRHPIHHQGQVVGWVVLASFQSVTDAGKQRLQERQLQTVIIASLVAVALAALIALWLARILLAPIRRVAHATHQLAAGRYETRVHVASQDEIGQLADDFNHLAQTLQRNEHMRRDFMADISHELRTPLSVLRGELEALEDGILPLNHEAIRSLQAEVGTLKKLVDDLHELSLSDVGALVYRFETHDLVQALQQSVDAMQPRFAQHGLSLTLQCDPPRASMQADAARLQQLFHNLLENSLRYTDRGGQVRIRLSRKDQHWHITVEDSAPGVAADQINRLFERFFRAENSRNRASGGSGLGLAICRNIVEAHAGDIAASASHLGGLCIEIRLPATAWNPEHE